MKFPSEWVTLGMYPDELFQLQRSGYKRGHEEGAEHDRNDAFHWWLGRSPSKSDLEKLLRLAALDPDQALGGDVRNYLREAVAFDADVAALEKQLFEQR